MARIEGTRMSLSPLRADNRGAVTRGAPFTRSFYQWLGQPPLEPDTAQARQYYATIMQLIDKGGWTRGEWAGLRRLERRWRARLDGQDKRWILFGTHAGRLDRDVEMALRPQADPDWVRPLARGETGE